MDATVLGSTTGQPLSTDVVQKGPSHPLGRWLIVEVPPAGECLEGHAAGFVSLVEQQPFLYNPTLYCQRSVVDCPHVQVGQATGILEGA